MAFLTVKESKCFLSLNVYWELGLNFFHIEIIKHRICRPVDDKKMKKMEDQVRGTVALGLN